MMKKRFSIIVGLTLIAALAYAEGERAPQSQPVGESYFTAKLGYGVGGTTPLPIPAEIREIKGFKPLCNLSVQGLYRIALSERWGIQPGLRIERKGMTSDATVKNYGMTITDDDGGTVSGRWTGDVSMTADMIQMTFPFSASFLCSSRWDLHAGLYLGLLLRHEFYGEVSNGYLREGNPTGAKIEVDDKPQTYDFSEEMRSLQWGATVGCVFYICPNFGIFADLNWGLNDIFAKDFTTITFNMYPIYATVGLSYSLK
jgi:hypothetical protein